MKKPLFFFITLALSLTFISWGYDGHYAVGAIAANHLSPNAQVAVKNLLGHKSMADVASYADELRANPAFKETGPLHYLNIEPGLNFDQFTNFIKTDQKTNIYQGIGSAIRDLQDPKAGKSKKEFALEFLIHLVGDAHQPMHVSREEDKGGGTIGVKFLNDNTNLHGLWDFGLLDHQHISYKNLAAKYDDATPQQIEKWQSDNVITWLWESYQISAILYKEAAENPNFDETYFNEHIPIVKNSIEKAGIRLAGFLNSIYK